MTPVIQLESITKRYGRQTALNQVSLQVPPGVVFALLGENGAGKSTAIKLMLGLAEADAGQAHVLGLNAAQQGMEIGWFAAGFYSADFESGYRRLVDQFQLPLQKKLSELSKGTRAKVSLALAMAHDPELLILDEPTSGLDTLVRREFLESMVDRAACGKTVFLSSHHIAEVERVADWVAMMRAGELIVVEPLETLKAELHELTITLADVQVEPPQIPGELLRQRRRARQWQVLVRQADPQFIEPLRAHAAIEGIEQRTPSLEEIFVAYMRKPAASEVDTAAPAERS